jgi:hypothetical protein
MYLKEFLQLKNPKNSLFWANIYKKKPKNPPKKTKNPLGWVFLYKKLVFSNPAW